MNYVFRRRAKHKSFAEFGLQVRKSRRFVNSFELSPQALATLRVTGGHIIEGEKAKVSLDASYLYGTNWFGATEDPDDISDREPNAQFHAIEFGVTRVQKPKKWGRWIVSARGKLSEEALYGPEQTPLGARSTVRGYRTAPLSADTAFYVRNDVMLSMDESWKDFAARLPGGKEGPLGTLAASLQPYVFADVGIGHSRSQVRTDVVGGFGGGLRIKGKRINFDIGGEIPIAKVEYREFNDPRFLATIGVNWP
jgi:hemolysin activation/secretion protein